MQNDYRLQSKKDGICILEIDELHQKAGGSFSYTVFINQVPVHQQCHLLSGFILKIGMNPFLTCNSKNLKTT